MTASKTRPLLRLLLLFVSLGAGIAGQYWLSIEYVPRQSATAWAIAAIAGVILYFVGRDAADLPARSRHEMSRTTEWVAFAAVLLIGLFFVGYRIDEIPAGLNHDAAWEGLYAIRILNGEPYTPYTPEAWGRETLTFYFRAAAIWLMGPTMRAIQAPGMLAGVLILPLFYVWTRTMFGVRLALMATLFLASSGWHLVFSRTGWRSDFQPLFMAMTGCFFVRGLERVRVMDFLLAGLGLALTLNIYNGSRVYPAVFAGWVILLVLQSWTVRGFVRRYGVGLLFMAIAFAIAIAPLAWFAVHDWETFQGRAAALRGASTLAASLKASLLLFNLHGNGDDFFIDDPALELPTAVLFVFGVLWSVLRWRDERAQFLLLGLIINLVPGMVSKPNLNRDIGTMVFVYFFCGLGALFFAQQLRRALGSAGRVASGGLLIAAAVAAMVATYSQFLGPERRPIWGFYPETTVLGHYLKKIVPGYSIWVGGANFPRDSLTYLSYQGKGEPRPNYVWIEDVRTLRDLKTTPRPGKGMAFVLANEGQGPAVLAELAQRYPSHAVEELRFPAEGGRVFAKALLVAPDGAAAPVVAAATDDSEAPPAEAPKAAAPAKELAQPRGVAVAANGDVVVADFGHHRVERFGRDGSLAAQWGGEGDTLGSFKEPSGVAVSADGRIAVADTWNGRIQFFTPEGKSDGQSAVAMYGPRGVAFAADGGVWVADTGNNRVLRLGRDGTLVSTVSEAGGSKLLGPVGIAVDAAGKVYVADNGNGRLLILSADGKPAGGFAVAGWANAVYSEPYVATDREGRIWLSVPLQHELRVFDAAGKLVRTVSAGDCRPPFDTPTGIAVDGGSGEVVVADLAGRIARCPAN